MPDGVTTALKSNCIVGESLIWDDRTERLLWVDILGKVIHALHPASGDHQTWPAPEIVTSIGLRTDGGAVVGLEKTVVLWDFGDEFEPLVTVEPDLPGNRLNEGVVGPDGAFWVGTMQNNVNPDGSPREVTGDTGRLYRVTGDGTIKVLSDDLFGITNTLAWTDDGRLITADTLKNTIYSYRYEAQTERLSDRTILLENYERGLPDGSCLDAEGYLWNCRVVGGSCLVRLSSDGRIDRIVELPCSWPTSCAFGGPALDTLFVTSARFTMSDEHLAAAPWEGDLFAVKPGVTGRLAGRFGPAAR